MPTQWRSASRAPTFSDHSQSDSASLDRSETFRAPNPPRFAGGSFLDAAAPPRTFWVDGRDRLRLRIL